MRGGDGTSMWADLKKNGQVSVFVGGFVCMCPSDIVIWKFWKLFKPILNQNDKKIQFVSV